MKKLHLMCAAVALTALTQTVMADDRWSVGISIGNPFPPVTGYYAAPPVVLAPPPVAIYRHPHSQYYNGYNGYQSYYPPAVPNVIQFSYGQPRVYGPSYGPAYNYGYGRGYDRGNDRCDDRPRFHNGGGYGHHHRW